MRATSQHLNEHLGVLMSNLYGPSTAIRSVVEKGGRWKCVQYHRRVPHAISIYKFAWRYCRGVGPKGVRPRHERITYHNFNVHRIHSAVVHSAVARKIAPLVPYNYLWRPGTERASQSTLPMPHTRLPCSA
jgi:hypothetical protein